MERSISFVTWLLVLSLFIGCGDTEAVVSKCQGDLAVGSIETFVDGLPGNTEGIVMRNDGSLFVSTPGEVFKISPEGTATSAATFESALGLAAIDKTIYVAGIGTGRLEKILPDGSTQIVATGLGKPNFVVASPWGTLLVSDDFTNRISEVTADGQSSLWLEGVPSPNGMTFSTDGARLYVVSTFEQEGLWQVEISDTGTGTAGAFQKVVSFEKGSTPDGVARSDDGRIYVALNIDKMIVSVDPSSGSYVTVVENLPFPASIAVGQAPFDACSLYVSNLAGKEVNRVAVGEDGLGVNRK